MTGILGGLLATFKQAVAGWTWTTQTLDTARYITAGTYAPLTNGSYFFFLNGAQTDTGEQPNTSAYLYSVDGDTWEAGTLPVNKKYSGAAFNGTTLVVNVAGVNLSGELIVDDDALTTTNGTTWTVRDTNEADPKWDVIWDGTRFLLTAEDTSVGLRHSTDGTTWTSIDPGPALWRIAYDGSSRYFGLPYVTNATNIIRTNTGNPTTAGNWVGATLPRSEIWQSAIFGNGTWLIFEADTAGNYLTSTDGTTWTQRVMPGSLGRPNLARNFQRPMFVDGDFYIVLLGVLYKSSDGVTWQTVTVSGSPSQRINAWAIGPNKIVGGGWGDIMTQSAVLLKGDK